MKFIMMQRSFAVGILSLLLFAACSKDNKNNGNNTGGNNNGDSTSATAVSIAGFKFSPATLTISNGATVTWKNNDSAPHTVTADDNSFTSATLNQGDTYTHKFTAAGTVNYHCSVHPMMTASVVVQ